MVGIEERIQSGSPMRFLDSTNRELGHRMIISHPPEPPPEMIMNDPLNSIYIGRTKTMKVPFYWTFEKLTNPHIAIVGVTGAGKSYLVKSFLTRAAITWNTNALIIDWAAEYMDWVKQTRGLVVELGEKNSLNLMDLGGNSPLNRIRQLMRTFDILLEGQMKDDEKRVFEESLEEAYASKGFRMHAKGQELIEPPTLKDVHEILLHKAKRADAVWVREYVLNTARLVGRFTRKGADFLARQSTLKLDKLTNSGLVDIVLKNLPDEEFRILAGLSILQYLKERMRDEEWSAEKGVKLFVVLDEAWKIAQDDRSDAIMIVREGRKYHFGLIVASQNPTDINEAIFSNVGSTFILNLKFQRFKEYVRGSLKYSDFIAEAIDRFGVGNAAVNLSYASKTDFPRTFLIERIHGEEPIQEICIDNNDWCAYFERSELKRKLGYEGFPTRIEEIIQNGKIDAAALARWLENGNVPRHKVVDMLCYLGMGIEDIRKVFARLENDRDGTI